MSTDKNLAEARRWLATAEDDLDSARLLAEMGKFAHSCSHAQQDFFREDAEACMKSSRAIIQKVQSLIV